MSLLAKDSTGHQALLKRLTGVEGVAQLQPGSGLPDLVALQGCGAFAQLGDKPLHRLRRVADQVHQSRAGGHGDGAAG